MKREWEEAIRDRETERIVDLVNAGTPIDARDRHGQTALMVAARHGWREVTALRGTGAPGFHGKTAAELADGSDQPAVARLIRERASLR